MQREPDQLLKALFWMVLSALGFSVMMVFVKRQSATIPQFEIVFFRSIVNFVVQIGILFALGQSVRPRGSGRLLVFRGIAGFSGMSCLFYAVSLLPISIAAVMNWLSPVFVIVFSRLFLKERIALRSLVWIGVVFVGVYFLADPKYSADVSLVGLAIGIIGAAFGGMSFVAVRAATAEVGVNVIILYFSGVSTLLSAPLAWANFKTPTSSELAELVLLGLCATVGQFAMTQGYRFAAAGIVSTMSLLNAVFSVLLGWLLLRETLGITQWGGLVLIFLGISAITLRNQSLPNAAR